jgi:hypothetical protein
MRKEEMPVEARELSLRVDGRSLLVVRILYGDLELEGRFDPLYNYGVAVSPSDAEEFLGCLRLLAADLKNVISALERMLDRGQGVSPELTDR